MLKIFFEEKGEELLKNIGVSKTEFARKMGIRKQNVKVLFKTRNIETIYKASVVLGVPFGLLVGYTSEPNIFEVPILPEETEDINQYGYVYQSFKGKPTEAFWFLIDHQEGDLAGVFHRDVIGDIDLVWGDRSCGVCHILTKHINKKDFPTVTDMIKSVTDIVNTGEICYRNPDKATLRKGDYVVVIRRNMRKEGKKPEPKNWILTAYSKVSSDATSAPPDIN